MEYIERLRVLLEAPGDDEDIDEIIDSEPEVDTGEDTGIEIDDDAKKASEEGESEVEQLIEKEKGVTDWTGIPNPLPGKTLSDLKGSKAKGIPAVKKPLENGWTTEEVISALKPTIIHFAKKYSTPTFSVEEAIAEQMTGVLEAIKNDKGLAPFTSHVYRYLSTSAQRGAGKASNVSGVPQTKGGKYDHLAAARAAVSADAPMPGEAEETYSSQIASHYDKAGEIASSQNAMPKLIAHLLNAPSIGLSEKEKMLLMAKFGITASGKVNPDAKPRTSKEIADALGVSVVRVSQIFTGAIGKIQEYMQARRFTTPEQAAQALGIEEAKLLAIAGAFMRIISESLKIELEMYSKEQIIEMKINYRGIDESVKIHVNSDTYEVDNAINEENESVLGLITSESRDEAISMAKTKTTNSYFVEMVNNVIGMQAQPVLATINNTINPTSNTQICFKYKNGPGVERAMMNAEYKVFGNTPPDMAFHYGGGASSQVVWWYPAKYAEQVNKMHEIMNQKGFGDLVAESAQLGGFAGRPLKPGTYRAEFSAPYKDGSGNTTYRVTFDIYGKNLEETAIHKIDDVDTGANNIDFNSVDIETIEMLVDEKIRKGEIEPIEPVSEGLGPQHGMGDSSATPVHKKLTKGADGRVTDEAGNEYVKDDPDSVGYVLKPKDGGATAWAAHQAKMKSLLNKSGVRGVASK